MNAEERNPWLENLFRPLVVGVMFGCIALSLVDLVRLVFPTWNGTYLVLGCVLAAMEATYSYRLVRAQSLRGGDLLRFRLIEIGLFFILLKIGSYIGRSWPDVVTEVQSWPYQPENLFDIETIAAFILALLAWNVSTQTARDFERLHEPPWHHRDYVSPMDSMTGRFFWGGSVLLVAAGLTRIGIAQLLNLRRPPVPGLVLNVLVYFVLGLVMLGQVRFATLRRRWQIQEIKIADELPRRWVRYSLALISLAALLAFLLPTGYTLGLLEVVSYILAIVAAIITLVTTVLLWLITLPLAWLLSLLGAEPPAPRPDPMPPQPLPVDQAAGAAPGWFQILQSLAFWVIALGMVFYVVRGYLRDHPELLQNLAGLGLVRALRRLWAALGRWLGDWGAILKERVPRSLSLPLGRRRRSPGEPFGFFRLGALSPRDQVLYYYLSILHRAARQGLPRRPAQTPDEYRAAVGPSLPEAQGEMEHLTQAFVEARYSRHAVESKNARRVRADWQQVKAALRALKRKTEEDT